VSKIDRVLRAPSVEIDLAARLAIEARRFSPERFMAGIRDAVEMFLARRGHV
jgi:hypothetical protein